MILKVVYMDPQGSMKTFKRSTSAKKNLQLTDSIVVDIKITL